MISVFNFGEHLLDIGCWKRILRRLTDGFELDLWLTERLAGSGGPERTPCPFSNRDPLSLCHPADFIHFGVRKEDLKAFTHGMSIT